jgi:hypothetical protein
MERVSLESKSSPKSVLVEGGRVSERGVARPSTSEAKRDVRMVEEDERYSNVPCTD